LVYPSCLEIKGVDGCAKTGGEGGFGVIHKGSLLGRTVALKKLKDQRQNYDKLTKVISTGFSPVYFIKIVAEFCS